MCCSPRHVGLVVALALGLGACGARDQQAERVVAIGAPGTLFESGSRLSPAAQLLRSATVEGLVALDEEGRVIPGLADRWIVTDDGRTYIFRLREGAWGDGVQLSSELARARLEQAIDGVAGTPLALDLAGVEEIRAMAGRVIEIRLSRSIPDFLQLLAQPELGLDRRGKGAGPMAARRDGASVVLTPVPPEKRGLPAVDGWQEQTRPLSLSALPGDRALAARAAGTADVVLDGTFAELPLVHRGALGKTAARFDPVLGLFGLRVTRTDGLLATPQMREAVAMTIDRASLATALGAPAWVTTTRLVSPGVDGDPGLVGERWTDLDIDGRRTQAIRRVAMWQAGAKGQHPALRLVLPAGPGANLLFDRLANDFNEIGISLQRVDDPRLADLALVDTVARYPRAAWFLNQLACGVSRGACEPAADALAARARAAADEGHAALLYAQAEVSLTQANVFIPLGAPIRWSLAAADAPGFFVNRWGFHPLPPLALRPR